jgi:hypothetical protein
MIKTMVTAAIAVVLACGGPNPAQDKVAEPLDPNAYRPHLALLDALIFEKGPIGNEIQLMLMESVGRFARDVELEGDHPETARALTEELTGLVGTMQEATGKHMESSGIPEQWHRIRDSFFQEAAWFRNSSEDPVDMGSAPRMGDSGQILADVPGMDTLAGVFTTLMVLSTAAERDLAGQQDPENEAKMLALLNAELIRIDSLLATPRDFAGDQHFKFAWTNAREASRLIKVFIATDADTASGSPGRMALEEAVNQLSAGMEELEKVGS